MTNIPTKVVTGEVRFSYAHVFEPYAFPGEDPKKARYEVTLIIPKSDKKTVDALNAAIKQAIEDGKSILGDKNGRINTAVLQLPLYDGDAKGDPSYKGCYYLKAKSNRKPGVVDANLQPIIEPEAFYSGCYGRASVNFKAFNNVSKGVGAYLNNVQKLKDGEPLGGANSAPEDDFGAAEDDLI